MRQSILPRSAERKVMRNSLAALGSTVFLAICLAISCTDNAVAQPGGTPETLVGTWIVLIESESETRTLVIDSAAPIEGGLLLAAKYNLSSRKPGPIEAKVIIAGGQRRLTFTTQAASIVNAVEQTDGSFTGTFTPKSGSRRAVSIRRADASIATAPPLPHDPLAEVALQQNIDPSCAAFHGNWHGNWAQGGSSEISLRVIEATSKSDKCILRLVYGSWKTPITVEFSGTTLSFLCNRTTQGTCHIKPVGSELWASYSNPAGGTNSATFRRSVR
jgi:hypothetical protein